MDWGYKAMLTAVAVAAVMMAARQFDRRVAGLLAGLPVITAPSLLWLANDQGAAFAAHSAAGSVAACAMAPVYALAFVTLARRRGPWAALSAALVAAAASASALRVLQGQLGLTLLACAIACVAVRLVLLHRSEPGGAVRPLRGEPWLSAGLAGLVTASVSQVALSLGPFWSGLLSSLPVISTFALVHLQRCGKAADLHRFVQGYLHGVWAKAIFAAAFALVAPSLGVPWAFGLACAAGAASMALSAALPRSPLAARLLARTAGRRLSTSRPVVPSRAPCASSPST